MTEWHSSVYLKGMKGLCPSCDIKAGCGWLLFVSSGKLLQGICLELGQQTNSKKNSLRRKVLGEDLYFFNVYNIQGLMSVILK